MKEITLKYLSDWKISNKFEELYHNPVCLVGRLDSSLMTKEETSEYENYNGDKWDDMYIKMVDIKDSKNNPKVYIGSSLKILLEKNWYKNYEWPVRIYGFFWIRPTTKTHVAKIRKAEILDEKWKIIDTFENEKLKPKNE